MALPKIRRGTTATIPVSSTLNRYASSAGFWVIAHNGGSYNGPAIIGHYEPDNTNNTNGCNVSSDGVTSTITIPLNTETGVCFSEVGYLVRPSTYDGSGNSYLLGESIHYRSDFEVVENTCIYALQPDHRTHSSEAVSGVVVNVETQSDCGWVPKAQKDWIHVVGANPVAPARYGSGTFLYGLDENTGPERVGTIAVATKVYVVTQEAGGDNGGDNGGADEPCDHGLGREITLALEAHFSGIVQFPAYLWLVEPKGKPVEGYTAHDRDIVYNPDPARFAEPILFQSVGGLSPSEVPASVGLSVDSVDVFLLLSGVTRGRIMTRYYEGARGTILLVNYRDLTQKHVVLMGGQMRTASVDTPNGVTFKLSTWSEILSQPIGRTVGPICPWRVMYGHCRNNVNGLDEIDADAPDDGPKPSDPNRTQSGTVAQIFTSSHLQLNGFNAATAPDNWAKFGYLRFVGGEYDGAEYQIKEWKLTGEVRLREPLPVLPSIGYAVAVEQGCDGTITMCDQAFNNAVNHGGQAYMPTDETLTKSKSKK